MSQPVPFKIVTKHTYSSQAKNTKLGMGLSPFQYLRNKLDAGNKKVAPSSGKGSEKRPLTAGGVISGVGKDLSKENSTETKRTAKTGEPDLRREQCEALVSVHNNDRKPLSSAIASYLNPSPAFSSSFSESSDGSSGKQQGRQKISHPPTKKGEVNYPSGGTGHLCHSHQGFHSQGQTQKDRHQYARPTSSSGGSRATVSHNYSRAQYRMGVSNRTPPIYKTHKSARPSSAGGYGSRNSSSSGGDKGKRIVYARPKSAGATRKYQSSQHSSGSSTKYNPSRSANAGGSIKIVGGGGGSVTVGGGVVTATANLSTEVTSTAKSAPKAPSQSRVRPQSAGAVTVSQRIAHRNFRTPEMIVKDAQKKMSGLDVGEATEVTPTSSAAPVSAPSGGAGVTTEATETNENKDSSNINTANTDNTANTSTNVNTSANINANAVVGGDRVYTHSQTHKSSLQAAPKQVVNAEALTNLSTKFCSSSELSYLQSIMSSGNLKGRSTTEFYTIGKVVGVGSFAKVRLAWHKLTGQAIAIKTYEKSKMKDASHLRRVQQEIKVMEKLNHPRLIRLFETLESPKRIHLIMEFVSAGNLCSYVKRRRRLPEEEARKIFYQISVALSYMHEVEIIHRDVKLENVLLDKDGNSKLIDFGFSVFSKDKKALKVFCGTPSYMAPEIVRRIEYEGKPVDAWSLGVVLYALVCGCFPFSAKSYPELYKKIMRGQFRIPDTLSQGVKDLIRNLLVLDPRKRFTVQQAKNHPWVHSGKGGAFNQSSGWTCDPGCSEILINKNSTLDLNESVIKTMDR